MDLQYREQQIQHHQHALETLNNQPQQPFATTPSISDPIQSPVTSIACNPGGTLPFAASDTRFPQSNLFPNDDYADSVSSALSSFVLPIATTTHSYPRSFLNSDVSAVAGHFDDSAPFMQYSHADKYGFGTSVNSQQVHGKGMDVTMQAATAPALCRLNTSYSYMIDHGWDGYKEWQTESARWDGAVAETGLIPHLPIYTQHGIHFGSLPTPGLFPRPLVDTITPCSVFGISGRSHKKTYDLPDGNHPWGNSSRQLTFNIGYDNSPNDGSVGSPLQRISPPDSTPVRPLAAIFSSESGSFLLPSSFGTHITTQRRCQSMNGRKPKRPRTGTNSRSHMSQEEKSYRAAASIGLSKEEKRKVQNKLAQRAFRERSKLKNRAGAENYLRLESITKAQDEEIDRGAKYSLI